MMRLFARSDRTGQSSAVRRWRWITLGVCAAWIAALHGDVLLDPDRYMFSPHGDAVKNYFTFAWHVKHDAGWLHFGGMNAPFGEHVGYTDGHPLVSLPGASIPLVKSHPVGTINLLLILSMWVTAWLLFELLAGAGARPWVACAGALAIQWMEPQVFRMEGHLALGHGWVIPAAILLWRWHLKRPDVLRSSALALFSLCVFLLHAYLGMIVVALWMCIALVGWLLRFPGAGLGGRWMMAAACISMAIFLGFMKAGDQHAERAGRGEGFLEYTASHETVFVPHDRPFRHLISQVIRVHAQPWEGWAYIGLPVMVILIVWIIRLVLGKKDIPDLRFVWLWIASIPILFFSFGWPFAWGWEEGLEYLPFVAQFRSPGRFAWVFYFSSGLLACLLLDRWTVRWNKGWMQVAAVLLFLGVMVAEGWTSRTGVARRIAATPNFFRREWLPGPLKETLGQWKQSRSTMLLPLPWFHYGSDIFGRVADPGVQRWSYLLSWHSGYPLMASANPRVSLQESKFGLNIPDEPGHAPVHMRACRDAGMDSLVAVRLSGSLEWDERLLWTRLGMARGGTVEWKQADVVRLFSDTAGYRRAGLQLGGARCGQRAEAWSVGKGPQHVLPPGEMAAARITLPAAATGEWLATIRVSLDHPLSASRLGGFVRRSDGREDIAGRRVCMFSSAPGLRGTEACWSVPFTAVSGVQEYELVLFGIRDYPISLEVLGAGARPVYCP